MGDIVRGLEMAADERQLGVYNLSTGVSYDFTEMVAMTNEVLGTRDNVRRGSTASV